ACTCVYVSCTVRYGTCRGTRAVAYVSCACRVVSYVSVACGTVVVGLVVVTMSTVDAEAPTTAGPPVLIRSMKKIRVHCGEQCINLYAEQFLDDSTDRTALLIADCIDQCAELFESRRQLGERLMEESKQDGAD
ncbi:hypothetical protein NP493_695g00005, partial [Ridgeia piscesae]